ncbi:MAG: ATP-binding protein, partial [Bacteroidota bacterium]
DSDIIFDFFHNYKNIKFIETKIKKYDNSLFDAEMQINKLDLKRRQFIQLIIRDITEKNAAQSELEKHRFNLEKLVAQRTIDLEKAKLKAEESDKLKTTFLANMSHEIRTPMNVIIGFADMLLDSDYSHEKQKEYLTLINNSGSALLKLINDIIDLSKIEANQLIIEKKQFNVIELLKEIERNFCETRNQQKKEDILIQMICKNKDISVFTDIFRLKQILTNLLNNALKFTKKGKIVFGCKKTGKFVQFFVNDTGIGIPDSMKEVVFEQFRQIDESTTKEYEGTGLGLTISKNLVLLLGGEIWVESELNVGSSFKFTIPVSDEILDIPETSLKSNVINYQNWLGKNLLVVEDENMNYKFIYEILYPTGIKIIRASDSVQAMEKLRTEKKINIILMDIQLPGQNGYETTKQIKALYPDIKVIAQTAFAMAGEREKCIAAGCNDYIAKPIRKKNLLNIIDKYL